jgi:2-(1,2-epoxy-1,2-dihydrophenyl)acetyl-CoA isomerase
MSDVVLVDHTDGVTTITLNRPDALNSLDTVTKIALRVALEATEQDPRARAIVLAGAGRAFCGGQDLREHATALENADKNAPAGNLSTVREHYNPVALLLAGSRLPVVAAVRGMAAGAGASLAFLADFRIGGPKTAFLMAFANVGLAGDTGVSWSLPRLVGHAKATELLMLAEPVRAQAAFELGLLTRLVDDDEQVLSAAQELAARLAHGPTVAYGQIKRQLAAGGGLAEALEVEADAQAISGATEDHANATAAFVRKEKPIYLGR